MAKPKFNLTGKTIQKTENTQERPETIDIQSLLAALAKPKMNGGNLETKLIPRRMLMKNPKNRAPMTNIESLAESILHFGLQQPITVVYATAEDKYIIETGHRRTTALDMLIEKFSQAPAEDDDYKDYLENVKPFENGYPCIIKSKLDETVNYEQEAETDADLDEMPEDLLLSEIRVLITNNEVRSESDPENQAYKQYEITRLAKLYSSLNRRRGKKDKVNVNEQIAKDMKITPRQVIKYKNVEKLIPELQEAFRANNITLSEADSFKNLSEEEQRMIVTMLEEGKKIKADEARQLTAEKKALEEQVQNKNKEIAEKEKEYAKAMAELEQEREAAKREIEALKKAHSEKEAEIREQLQAEVREQEEVSWQSKIAGLEKEYESRKNELEEKLREKEQTAQSALDQIEKLQSEKAERLKENQEIVDAIKAQTILKNNYDDAVNSIQRFCASAKQCGDKGAINNYVDTLMNLLKEVN